MRQFFLSEDWQTRSDFVGNLASFNYLNIDIRSLLIKYRCFFRKNGGVASVLHIIVSRGVWFFFLSFIFLVWFSLLFFFYS